MKPHNTMPFLFFTKGKLNLQPNKTLGIVGTRKCTEYGKTITRKIVKELADISDLTIVSGLAFGIDKTAHQSAVDNNLQTIGVLGHGLQTIYPSQNKKLANQMIEHDGSGLLSQFCSTQTLLPANFPKRNEVIAGLSDAVLVVETDLKGGSTITVEIAFGMNKDILAIPGKVGDKTSRGCNSLIKYNKAALVENANDIKRLMSWTTDENAPVRQKQLFIDLTETETTLVNCLKTEKEWHVDILTAQSKFTPSSLSATLLSLEMKGVVQSLPGKIYRLI
ncbi:UNVERIFIED_CONTAM: hypothetical protein GTU68_026748 [Idotea baltica]|nr:hypothetical protein [Idotea baltica]